MKLTQPQIEIERAKFEAWHAIAYYPTLLDGDKYTPTASNDRWLTWLASRESSNEITLNVALCGHGQDYKRGYNEAIGDIKDLIERQGYTIKQGE